MTASRFFWRRAFPSLLLVSSFLLLYESTVSDSRYAARQAELLEGELKPAPGTRLQFEATAYCKGQTTASGVGVRSGVAAIDLKHGVEIIRAHGKVVDGPAEQRAVEALRGLLVRGRELDPEVREHF